MNNINLVVKAFFVFISNMSLYKLHIIIQYDYSLGLISLKQKSFWKKILIDSIEIEKLMGNIFAKGKGQLLMINNGGIKDYLAESHILFFEHKYA